MKRTTNNNTYMQNKSNTVIDTKKAQKPTNIFSLLNNDSEHDSEHDSEDDVKSIHSATHTDDLPESREEHEVKKIDGKQSKTHESNPRVDHLDRRFKKVIKMEDGDGWMSNKPKGFARDKRFSKSRDIYTEEMGLEKDMGNDKKLNSYWTVWVHRNNCMDWTLASYQKIFVINSIGSFWRFFCNFQSFNTFDNHIFIMREEIAPIWEDVNNKFGGICSIKVDSTQTGFKTDISTEMMILITMLIVNETFTANSKNINGVEFSIKKRSALIKIWTKAFVEDDKFINSLPVSLFNCFDAELERFRKGWHKDSKLSYQYKQIKPEYEV